ncbi:MAG: SHOCT domain-containing protein [Sedimentibacter sp.]|nr:SHOCT domain-containing protein [Sedimentibacter sp.]HNZ82810.1 SHOCT domain-containing protein [Sedimentibacter sp.]
MSKKIKVKPSKGQSTAGFFVGIVFCLIGLFVAIPIFGPFGIFWTMIAVIITVMNGKNAFTEEGVSTHEIIIEDNDTIKDSNLMKGINIVKDNAESLKDEDYVNISDSKKRLEQIKVLYENGFMTREEYEEKRKSIIADI